MRKMEQQRAKRGEPLHVEISQLIGIWLSVNWFKKQAPLLSHAEKPQLFISCFTALPSIGPSD